MRPYEALGFRVGDFPVAELAAAQVLSLPMFPELTAAQQRRVVAAVRHAARRAVPTLEMV
jgi:dTDP-4-amino-4,6-dideoxygalactose transaminase